MNGILIVDKPDGLTSAEVVRRVKSRIRVKVGHLGTLDPFATGILPLCLGEATKIAQYLNAADKTYVGQICLGLATDTGDRTGATVRTAAVPKLDAVDLAAVEQKFTGDYQQVPPMYSALKRSGVPLYKLARRGIEVEREARSVHVANLHLQLAGEDRLQFEVSCSKGTYVRVLAEDIGLALRTEAHLSSLRRIRFGAFGLEQAVSLESWGPADTSQLVSIREALSDLPTHCVTNRVAEFVRQGKTWVLDEIESASEGSLALLVDSAKEAVAVIARRDGRWSFGRVLNAPADPLQHGEPMVANQVE
jgi:tRNA pseudouridine55 synthase